MPCVSKSVGGAGLTMTEYIERDVVIDDIGDLFTICYETLPNEYGHHFIVEKELQTHLDFVRNLPAADVVEVVRCKDCKHRPYSTEPGKTYGLTIEAPDGRCPCYNEDDGWYSWVPDNEFFCSYGERKEVQGWLS